MAYTAVPGDAQSRPGNINPGLVAAAGGGSPTRTVPASAALRATVARTVPASAALSSGTLTRTVPASAALSANAFETWHQHGGAADRRGGVDQTPSTPWRFLWADGPDAGGGLTSGRRYAVPPEAYPICGGTRLVQPRGAEGLYAFTLATGALSWSYPWQEFVAPGAYHPTSDTFWFGSTNGKLYKIPAAGTVSGIREYDAGSPIRKAVAIDGDYAYCVCADGSLHKVLVTQTPGAGTALAATLVYGGGSTDDAVRGAGLRAETPPAISASGKVVYATSDGYVHCVLVSTLRRASGGWRVAPHSATWGGWVAWSGWPVVAEAAGVVLLRCQLQDIANTGALALGPVTVAGQTNRFPASTGAGAAQADAATIRTWFGTRASPGTGGAYRNLFALNLSDGGESFVPAVGYGSTEDYANGQSAGVAPPPPAVKRWSGDAKEIAYTHFRNGSNGSPDFRWDGNLGEMPLDGATVSGFAAGEPRFVQMGGQFSGRTGAIFIADEQAPLTYAGSAVFHPHWDGSEGALITDRAASKGDAFANPIAASELPYVARSAANAGTKNAASRYRSGGGALQDTRYIGSTHMYWVYWGVHDPPSSPLGETTYSAGQKPRYTFAHNQYLVVCGNGGDLTVFRHSGTSPNGTWATPAAPTALTLTGPNSGKAAVASDLFTLALSPAESLATTTITCTLSDGAAGGVFRNEAGTTITTIALTSLNPAQRFSYTPPSGAAGTTVTISVTNDGGLTNP